MDISMVRGDTPSFTFTVLDPYAPKPDGKPGEVNLTGASIRFTVRLTIDAGGIHFEKSTSGGSIVILNQTTFKGQCRVDLANADTAALAFPVGLTTLAKAVYRWRLPYDLQVVLAGKITTPARGLLVITPEVTVLTN